MSAPMRPPASATPAPISATKVTATTPKPAKLGTNDVKMKRMPSVESRLTIGIVTVLDVPAHPRTRAHRAAARRSAASLSS